MSEKYKHHETLRQEDVAAGAGSHERLLQMVSPNATVLECGPAYGVMTKYMKEVLHCKVYIIEVDPESYAHALSYAAGGVCADIEDDAWMDQFEAGGFDYIIYADVLEHLCNPQAVLAKMRKFLKPDGAVLLSVPNIAHGDIIMNLLCDQFNYTPLGLLDNTHIHFFTYKSLREMIAAAGYILSYEYAGRKELFTTEQGAFLPKEQRADLLSALSGHTTADILQFICRLTLTGTGPAPDLFAAGGFTIPFGTKANFYFDDGSGFSVETARSCCGQAADGGRIVFDVPLPERCVAVRYDPVEGYPCVVRESCASVDGSWMTVVPLNGVLMGGMAAFQNPDPQMLIKTPAGGRTLHLEVFVTALSCGNLLGSSKVTMDIFREARRLLTEKDMALEGKDRVIAEKERAFQAESDRLKEAVKSREAGIADQKALLEAAWRHSADMERQLQLSQGELAQCRVEQREAAVEIERLKNSLGELQEAYGEISNAFFWKISKPLRWLLDKVRSLHR